MWKNLKREEDYYKSHTNQRVQLSCLKTVLLLNYS
jgi:hypothetical protein